MASAIQVAPQTELVVTGMNCANCARHVTEALQGVAGVDRADVSLSESRARVRWRPEAAPNVIALSTAVREAGYEAKLLMAESKPRTAGWRLNVVVGLAGTIPMMAGEWIFHWDVEPWFQWLSFGLALVVQVLCGARFYRGAWQQLKKGASNMDTLVALGSTAAFGFSIWAFFSRVGGHLYFMEAAAIITLISVGHWLEGRASVLAEKSMRALFQLAPQMARRRNHDGAETDVAVADLKPGDCVVLRPGDRVATDGTVIEGETSVDEAMLTGESLPVEKRPDSKLYAGTLNLNGNIAMNVTAVGEATAMARIIAAVERAQ
ncbi:MAG TPA: HAD-IC family P-type ATPase, partial [Verrucomicrobiae bacterium]